MALKGTGIALINDEFTHAQSQKETATSATENRVSTENESGPITKTQQREISPE